MIHGNEVPITKEEKKVKKEKEILRGAEVYPVGLDRFLSLKKTKRKIEDEMCVLQKTIIFGPGWLWKEIRGGLSCFSYKEKKLIDLAGESWCKDMVGLYLQDKPFTAEVDELMLFISRFGVWTNKREDCILKPEYRGKNHYEKVVKLICQPLRKSDIPGFLNY